MWVNEQAETQCGSYVSKFKEVHGDTSDPTSEDFDVEVAVLAGQGKKGGRLWIGDGLVDPMTIPSLRHVRRGRTSDQPRVETRPRASDLAVERLRVCSSSVLYLHYMFSIAMLMTSRRHNVGGDGRKGTEKPTGGPAAAGAAGAAA